MGFLLLWFESLAVSLLFMAWVAACIGRWKRPWLRALLWMPVALALLSPYALVALCTGVMKFGSFPNYPWFYYGLGLAMSVLAGMIVLGVAALRRYPTERLPTVAARWPRGRLFILSCVALALHVATIQNLSNAASRQIETLREESEKTLYAAVPASAAEAENALPLYEQAAEAFQCWTGNQQRWLEEKAASFDAKDPQLAAFMREREPAARLLHAAAKRPACVFRVDPRIPCRAGASLLAPVSRHLALFLTVHCRCKLAEGNRQAAWQDVYTLFQFAAHIRERMWINTSTEAWHIEKQGIRSLQYVLNDVQPTAEELARVKLDESFSWQRSTRDFFPVLAASGVWFLTLPEFASAEDLQYYGYLFDPPTVRILFNTGLYRIFFFPIDLAFYRRVARVTEIGLAWPYYEAIKNSFYNDERQLLRNPLNVGAIVTATSNIATFFLELPKACAKADARRAIAVTALAVERFRTKHGRLPADLDALVPEFLTIVPFDPFDGKPIKYQLTPAGAVVSSVGNEMIEDVDVFEGPSKKPEKNDLTFELRRRNP